MACRIFENLIIISSEPVWPGSNTLLARVKNELNIWVKVIKVSQGITLGWNLSYKVKTLGRTLSNNNEGKTTSRDFYWFFFFLNLYLLLKVIQMYCPPTPDPHWLTYFQGILCNTCLENISLATFWVKKVFLNWTENTESMENKSQILTKQF